MWVRLHRIDRAGTEPDNGTAIDRLRAANL
jgi:hypothetical protein